MRQEPSTYKKKGTGMYCTIIERQCKKVLRSYVYKKIKWQPIEYDPLNINLLIGTWIGEDEILRDPREKWDIILNETFRRGGKVKKNQAHICTVRRWDIVDGFYFDTIHESIERYFFDKIREELGITKADLLREKSFAKRPLRDQIKQIQKERQTTESYKQEYGSIYDMVYAKFQPIIDRVEKEYKKSEEYRVKTQNEKLKEAKAAEIEQEKKRQEEKARWDNLFGRGYYDAHHNHDGSYNSKGAHEWEKTHKEQEHKSDYSSYSSSYNFDFMKSSTFSGPEKTMAEELIVAGYKALAKKYHPDIGGSNEQFQELGNIKEKLAKML